MCQDRIRWQLVQATRRYVLQMLGGRSGMAQELARIYTRTYRLLARAAEDRVQHRALGVVDMALDVALDVLQAGPGRGLLSLCDAWCIM